MPVDSTDNIGIGTSVLSISKSITPGGGSNRFMAVGVSVEDNNTPPDSLSSITYNGTNLTQVSGSKEVNGINWSDWWYLLDTDFPGAAANLVVTFAAEMRHPTASIAFVSDAVQAAPHLAAEGQGSSVGSVTVNISPTVEVGLLLLIAAQGNTTAWATTSGQTQHDARTGGASGMGIAMESKAFTSSGSNSMTVTSTGTANRLCVSVIAIEDITAGPTEKAASESIGVGMTDSFDNMLASLSREDTLPATLTEAVEFFNTMTISDSLGAHISENVQLVVSLSHGETIIIGLTDISDVVEGIISIVAAESIAINLSDLIVALQVFLSLEEVVPFGLQEAIEAFVTAQASESVPAVVSDDGSLAVTVASNDTTAIQITDEVLTINVVISGSDTTAIVLQESEHFFNTVQADDTAIGLVDALDALLVSLTATDSPSVILIEVGTIEDIGGVTAKDGAESLALALLESVSLVKTGGVSHGSVLLATVVDRTIKRTVILR